MCFTTSSLKAVSVRVSCASSSALFSCLFVLPYSGLVLFYFLLFSDAYLFSNEKEKERVWIWGGVGRIWEEFRERKL